MLAITALAGALLIYGLSWFLQYWDRRLIAQVNRSLRLPIAPFLMTDRREIIERLLSGQRMRQRILEQAAETGLAVDVLERRCRRYAEEIVPSFKAVFYFRIGYWLARSLLLSLYRVHSRVIDAAALDAIEADASVVLVSNHRSNMDVLLVNYLASRRSTLMHAAGEWARLWPLHHLVRLAGNCIVDRDAADPIYKGLMKDFVQLAVRERANLAIFPEGELTRDGRLQTPKLGLLSYAVTGAASGETEHPIYLIPVSLNFDRIPEEDSLLADTHTAYRRRSRLRLFLSAVRATVSLSLRVLDPRRAQFGNACAAFGPPIALGDWRCGRALDHKDGVSDLGEELMRRVAQAIPVMPSHVLATLFAADPQRSWPETTLLQQAARLTTEFHSRGAVVCEPDPDMQQGFSDALRQFVKRKLVCRDRQDRLCAAADRIPLLRYLANSVQHLLTE